MAEEYLLVGVAMIAAFGVGVFVLGDAVRRVQRKYAVLASAKGESGLIALVKHGVTHGVKPLQPLVDKLMAFSLVACVLEFFADALRREGASHASARSCGSASLAALLALMMCFWLMLGSLPSALAVCAGVVVVMGVRVMSLQEKRVSQDRQCIPETLQSMRACFQAGFSLQQTMGYLAEEAPGKVRCCYQKVVQSLRLGCPASDALAALRQESHAPELVFVSAALDVQHQTGGSLTPILLQAETSARAQFELERSLQVQTAQARMSSQVVTVMPFALLAVFSLISEGFLDPFFESAAGFALLVFALGMEIAGVLSVRKMLRVKGLGQ